jgi:hypothetical protein
MEMHGKGNPYLMARSELEEEAGVLISPSRAFP